MAPGPARSLTVPGIAAAGVAIADASGLDAVTMRSVATALGGSAAALYRYVSSREELIGHMVDLVGAGVVHPPPSGDWLEDLLGATERQVALHRAHPWLGAAAALPLPLGPHALDHLEWGLGVLAPVEAPARSKMEAIAMITGIATLFAAAGPVSPEVFRHLDAERHPRLVAQLGSPGAAGEDLLRRVVTGILTAVLGG
jgi:AcrR family transcriptional regulator